MIALGKHVLVECHECDAARLNEPAVLEEAFLEAARAANATPLGSSFHTYEPHGVSGFVAIAESHLSIHTWPEHRYAAVDIFSCGDSLQEKVAVEIILERLQCQRYLISGDLRRGVLGQQREERDRLAGMMTPSFREVCCDTTLNMSWEEEFERVRAWGLQAAIDVYQCDPHKIRSKEAITRFLDALLDVIKMRPFGETHCASFGEDNKMAGYSMVQLIETSIISGHFANHTNTAYLDVFSCKSFSPQEAAVFSLEFFGGSHYELNVQLRR